MLLLLLKRIFVESLFLCGLVWARAFQNKVPDPITPLLRRPISMSGESVPMSLDQIPLEPPPQEKHVNWGQAEIREHGRFLDEENKL